MRRRARCGEQAAVCAPARCCCTTTCQLLLYYSAALLHTKWPGPALPNTQGCGAPKGAVRRRTRASSLGQPRAHNESRAQLRTHKTPRGLRTHRQTRTARRRSLVSKAAPQAESAHHRVQGSGAIRCLVLCVRGWVGGRGRQRVLDSCSVPTTSAPRATSPQICMRTHPVPPTPPTHTRTQRSHTRPGVSSKRPWRRRRARSPPPP